MQRRRERLVFEHKFKWYSFRVGHRAAGQKHAAQERHPAAFAHRDLARHAAAAHLDSASLQHKGASLPLISMRYALLPPSRERLSVTSWGCTSKTSRRSRNAPGDGVVFRFNGEALVAAAAIDDRTGGADDAAQFCQQAADAVRLKAAKAPPSSGMNTTWRRQSPFVKAFRRRIAQSLRRLLPEIKISLRSCKTACSAAATYVSAAAESTAFTPRTSSSGR